MPTQNPAVIAREVGHSDTYFVVAFRAPNGETGVYHVGRDVCPELDLAVQSVKDHHGEGTVALALIPNVVTKPVAQVAA